MKRREARSAAAAAQGDLDFLLANSALPSVVTATA
jgi:hypothetical protein